MSDSVHMNQKLENVFSKCSLCLENEELSSEHLLKAYIAFLDDNMFCEEHKTITVLAAENRCFDAVTIACAALSCILSDEIDPKSIISQLEVGDKVEYIKSRYVFKGFNDKYGPDYIELIKDNGEHKYVEKKGWGKIKPYYGKAESFDGRGIRKLSTLRNKFYKDILGKDETEIPSIVKTSVIMIMSLEDARYYLENISFCFDADNIPLLDLITASYYTENNVIRFRGNSAANDPVLKITSKASNAQVLIYEKTGNDNIGVIVLGQDVFRKNYTELPNLVSRRKLQYSLLSMKVDDTYAYDMVNQYDDSELFVCTKDFLLSTPLETVVENRFTNHLTNAIDHIVDHEITKIVVEADFSADDYYSFKAAMSVICHQVNDNRNDKDNLFIRQAYALMKLFISAPFTMARLEKNTSNQIVCALSAKEKLENIRKIVFETSPYISEKAGRVIQILENAYNCFLYDSGKESYLTDILRQNEDQRVAIIVPYEYYIPIMKEMGVFRYMKQPSYLSITTPAGFDNEKEYDLIITTALLSSNTFDVFRSHVAFETIVIIYSFENRLYKSKERHAAQVERHFNTRSTFNIEVDEPFEDIDESAADLEVLNNEDLFVDGFIHRINTAVYYNGSILENGKPISNLGNKSLTVRSAVFEDEEIAFFTKNYKAYVLDSIEETVSEKSVDKLTNGDTLIFTRSNENTRDIVEIILQKIIENEKVSDEVKLSYQRSIRWKEDLLDYKQQYELTNTDVVKRLLKENAGVGEMAIRTWLDPDTHIVRPRSPESLQAIARLTGDDDLENNVDVYIKACDDIYRLRGSILKEIGKAIIGRITGNTPENGTYLSEIYDRLDTAAQILRIDTISDIQQEVPVNYTNRPVFP